MRPKPISNDYIERIVSVCNTAKPNQHMMFNNFDKYILYITKENNNTVQITTYEKNAVKREGRYKNILVNTKHNVPVADLACILCEIAK